MSRLIQVDVNTELITEECCSCGVIFAMPKTLQEKYIENGKSFYCPMGHTMCYTESTGKKLRQAQERLREQRAYASTLIEQRDGALKRVSVHKGLITRMKNRVRNGVCIHCNRHFADLENHMKTKHPEKLAK